jgi:type IV pilus assembly protein PilY1
MSPFAEADGTVRYVYGGDLLGNVWRFDLALNATDAGAVNRVAQLRDAGGGVQPVTAAPELLSSMGKRIVFVGTGRLLDISDFGRVGVQSMYAVADGSTLANARNSLVPRVLDTTGSGSLSGPALDWSTQRGWYLDLPVGEQVNHRPALAYGALAWIGNRTGKSDCSASARLFVVDALLADKFPKSSFVTSLLSGSSNASGLTGVLTRDGQFVRFNTRLFEGGDVDGRSVNAGAVIDPAKNSWREIRR